MRLSGPIAAAHDPTILLNDSVPTALTSPGCQLLIVFDCTEHLRTLISSIMASLLAYLFGFGGPKPQQPPPVPSDDIVPSYVFDDAAAFRNTILMWTFRFTEVLDPEKLHRTLWQVLEMEGWRKLGGRIRLGVRRRPRREVNVTHSGSG